MSYMVMNTMQRDLLQPGAPETLPPPKPEGLPLLEREEGKGEWRMGLRTRGLPSCRPLRRQWWGERAQR